MWKVEHLHHCSGTSILDKLNSIIYRQLLHVSTDSVIIDLFDSARFAVDMHVAANAHSDMCQLYVTVAPDNDSS